MASSPKSPGSSNPPGLTADEKRVLAAIDLDRMLVNGKRLSSALYIILVALLSRAGRPVTEADLGERLWGHQEDGGPLNQALYFSVAMLHLRAIMEGLGGRLEHSHRQTKLEPGSGAWTLHLPGFYGS